MSDLEYTGLVLEDQLLDHLATTEGCMAVWRERLSPDIIPEVNDGVRDALIFVIRYIDEYGVAPDVSILSEETGYEDFEEPIAPIEYIIDKMKERNVRKELKQALTRVGRQSGDPKQALQTMFQEASRIMTENLSYRKVLDTYNMSMVVDRYERRRTVHETGISYGYTEMDLLLGGMRIGELYFVIARPKRYKTWQLIKSASETFQNGNNVVFHTLEMKAEEMQDRFLCMISGVSWDQFQHNSLPPADVEILKEASAWLGDQPHKLMFNHPPINERTVSHMKQFALEHQPDVMYVDQLSWITPSRPSPGQRWLEIAYICEELKDAAEDFPIMCAAQFNRNQALIKPKSFLDLELSNIGLGDSIGATADMVLGIFANKDMMSQRGIHYGVIDSRTFEPRAWDVKVELGLNSNFRVIDEVDFDA